MSRLRLALLLASAVALLIFPRSASTSPFPEIPFPLRLQPNVGYFLPISSGVDTIFAGSLKVGITAIVPIWRDLEMETGVEKAFLEVRDPPPPGIRVKERTIPFTAGFRWGGYAPRPHARIYGVGGAGAYRKTVEISGAGADTLGPEVRRTDFGFYVGGGFQIETGDWSEVDVSIRVHTIRAGPSTVGWDTWTALTAGYSFRIGRK